MEQGEQFIAAGDFVTARIALQRAAEAGDGSAAVAVRESDRPCEARRAARPLVQPNASLIY
jgi:hypothetical protein